MLSVVLAIAVVTGAAWCFPTRFGPATGLVDLPTSDVIEQGVAEFALDYTALEGGQKIWPARILFGVSDAAELGVGFAKMKDGTSEDITSFSGKMTLMREPEARFGLGVGAATLDGTTNDLLNVYAVASKQFPMPAAEGARYAAGRARLRAHAGIMFTRVRNGISDNEIKPFLGFDVTSPEGTAFVAEYKWTKFGDDHVAAAIRYPVTSMLTAQAGVARAGTILGQSDYRFIIGLSYNLSPSVNSEPGY
jgi:hypothetical protein